MPEHVPDATASDRSATRKAVVREGRGLRLPKIRKNRPGTAAGINREQLDGLQSGPGEVRVTVIDYRADNVLVRTIDDIDGFVAGHRPEWSAVCWINVDGLTDMKCVSALAAKYQLHPLAVEDLLHVPQRPKVDAFGEGPAGPARYASRASVRRREDAPAEGRAPLERADQLLRRSPHAADVPGEARRRVGSDSTAAPEAGLAAPPRRTPAFSCYALIDAIVDHGFPILEFYGDRLEEIEEQVLLGAGQEVIPRFIASAASCCCSAGKSGRCAT